MMAAWGSGEYAGGQGRCSVGPSDKWTDRNLVKFKERKI